MYNRVYNAKTKQYGFLIKVTWDGLACNYKDVYEPVSYEPDEIEIMDY